MFVSLKVCVCVVCVCMCMICNRQHENKEREESERENSRVRRVCCVVRKSLDLIMLSRVFRKGAACFAQNKFFVVVNIGSHLF